MFNKRPFCIAFHYHKNALNILMVADWQKLLAVFNIVSPIAKILCLLCKCIHRLYSCDKLSGCLCQSCSAYLLIFHLLFIRIKCWQSKTYVCLMGKN